MQYIKKAEKSAEENSNAAREKVIEILANVEKNGEAEIVKLAKEFDNWDQGFILSEEKKKKLIASVPEHIKKDIQYAHKRISEFAKLQRDSIKDFEIVDDEGAKLGQKVVPMDVAGCYVPGGRFAHVCSALMSVATAKAAGVPFIVAATPPRGDSIDAPTCYAMDLAGADIILEMGGVQAIATMAYGLFTNKAANIIVGPGNAFVAEAKAVLSGTGKCAIDVFAGPTESGIIADETADPMTVAIDLVSQAEHGYNSPVWLFTTSRKLAEEVAILVPKLCADMPDPDVPLSAWRDYGEILLFDNDEEMLKVSDEYASEHIQILTKNNDWWKENSTSYGSMFIGEGSTVPHGDKCAGPNHILPTKKAGYNSGGLNAQKFLKIYTYQELSKEGNKTVGAAASRLSRVEGMEGHARACDWRLTKYFGDEEFDFHVYRHPKY